MDLESACAKLGSRLLRTVPLVLLIITTILLVLVCIFFLCHSSSRFRLPELLFLRTPLNLTDSPFFRAILPHYFPNNKSCRLTIFFFLLGFLLLFFILQIATPPRAPIAVLATVQLDSVLAPLI